MTGAPHSPDVHLEVQGGVALVRLQRPGRLNALSPALMRDLIEASTWLGTQDSIRCVVLSGAGSAFCAGFDLAELRLDAAPDEDLADLGRRCINAWAAQPAITIAAVQGPCLGGGLLLAAACDLRVASFDACFALPEIELGIPLAWGGIPRLVRLLGPTRALEWVLDAPRVDARQALAQGLINRCLEEGESAHAAARAWAQRIAQRPALALRQTKQRFAQAIDALSPVAGSEHDAEMLRQALADEEVRAVLAVYLARRARAP